MASIIKADNIQKVSDGSNIIKKCGSTITLGSCGATISLACGATQTGFGQTYSAVEYCTTAKTSPFTAAAGTGYFINTTCGAVTVTLPASPTAGDVVAFKDYASQWNTNAVTLCNNGNKINGVCATASLSTQNQSVTLIYVDGTKGWQDIQDSTAGISGGGFITATGGTISCSGDYKIHTFTSDGTFTVTGGGGPLATVDYLVVAGGGSGGTRYGGGGGGGGYRESYCATVSGCYTASPLATPTSLPVSVQAYPITVGGGGSGVSDATGDEPGNRGSSSVFSTITSTGGGGGQGQAPGTNPNIPGGSGGGGSYAPGIFGAGNTPPVSPPQGNNGGTGNPGGSASPYAVGGGGGAGAAASAAPGPASGTGGAGSATSISGSPVTYAGGGGGGATDQGATNAPGGSGGGTAGGSSPGSTTTAGTANTGGGSGGGYGAPGNSGAGGSGIVIIRYKFQ
jgi:hypothetical protein